MVVIRKNWDGAVPITQPTETPQTDSANSISIDNDPDTIDELSTISHNESYQPPPQDNIYSNTPKVTKPVKRSKIIPQRGIMDHLSFNSTSLMIGGAVVAGLVFLATAGKKVATSTGSSLNGLNGFY